MASDWLFVNLSEDDKCVQVKFLISPLWLVVPIPVV